MAEKVEPRRFPIGFWPTGTPEITAQMMDDWVEAGVTLTYAGAGRSVEKMKRVLDLASERGIQIVICDPRVETPRQGDRDQRVPDGYGNRVQTLVADFGAHPAAYGFKIADEPDPRNFRAVCECAKVAADRSGGLHVVVNNFAWYPRTDRYYTYEHVQAYRDEYLPLLLQSGVDIVSYDSNYHMNTNEPGEGWALFFGSLHNYGEFARRRGLDFWNIILASPHLHYKVPNEAAIRWQFNCSIAYGCRGVFYYTFYTPAVANFQAGPIDQFGERTEKFEWLRRIHKAFHDGYGNLFLEIRLLKAMQAGRVFGPVPAFEPDDLILSVSPLPYRLHGTVNVDPQHPFVVSRFAGAEGQQYVMVVNNSCEESVECNVAFHDPQLIVHRYVRAAGATSRPRTIEERDLVRHRDRCEVRAWLAPGQEVVFRLETPK